jgi:hypothetical protein
MKAVSQRAPKWLTNNRPKIELSRNSNRISGRISFRHACFFLGYARSPCDLRFRQNMCCTALHAFRFSCMFFLFLGSTRSPCDLQCCQNMCSTALHALQFFLQFNRSLMPSKYLLYGTTFDLYDICSAIRVRL